MTNPRELVDAVYRLSFASFVYRAFEVVNPGRKLVHGWHIDCICYLLQQMVEGRSDNRLVVNLPPRSLKSYIISVCLVAWLLGRDPTLRIICASYAEDLSAKFSRDCRALMETKFYKRLFPRTRLNPKKTTESEFETTRGGFRLATSTAGILTGRGGDILIIDDPTKAADVNSKVGLQGASEWLSNTVVSRLDHLSKGLIIVTMQRLHVDDLSGVLIGRRWPALVIPAIATEPSDYALGPNEFYHRPIGEALQPERNGVEALKKIKDEMGSRIFAAQFQQDPMPLEGNLIESVWLARYSSSSHMRFHRIVLSCDPAGKAGATNDFTALIIAGIIGNHTYILDVVRGHWTVLQMKQHIIARVARWNADLVIVEDTSSGTALIELLKEQSNLSVVGRQPKGGKEERMLRQLGKFEAGRVLLPTEAAWLADFEKELLSFPNGKFDDQVDALMQVLEWCSPMRMRNEVDLGRPIQVKCGVSDPFSGEGDGSTPWLF
jgi:predicted phage terminase large subunit-like protein